MVSPKSSYYLRKLGLFFVIFFFALTYFGSSLAFALSPDQKALFYKNIRYYDLGCSGGVVEVSDEAVSGTVQELAQQMLDDSNITYWTNNGVNTRDVVVALSQGKPAYTTAPDGQPKTAEINPNILIFILEAAKEGKVMVNALTDKDHSSDSNHYKGLAVDLDNNPGNTTVPAGRLIEIAGKYDGKKNSESSHYHFDFLKRPKATPSGSGGTIEKVFMVGDSITYTAALSPHNLGKAFKEAGIEAVISGSAGGNIDNAGTLGDPYSGLEAINKYKRDVKEADAVVVAHGTNHFPGEFKGAIKRMVNKIKSVNSSAAIFWVNTYTKGSGGAYSASASKKKNNIIASQAAKLDFQVIDVTLAGINLNSDGIHPEFDESGMGVWRDTVVEAVSKGADGESDSVGGDCTCGDGSVSLSGRDNAEKIWNFLLSNNFTAEQVAGFLGNFSVETGDTFSPTIVQGGGNDPEITVDGVTGYGIAQWTSSGRQQGLKDFADGKGLSSGSLEAQLLYVMYELKHGESAALGPIKAAGTVEEAWSVVSHLYERPAEPDNPERGQKAQEYFDLFSGGGGAPVSGGGGGGCAAGGGGEGEVIDGVAWPVPKKWWDSNPEYFTSPHHDYPAVDILVPTGTEVFSMLDGSVITVESSGKCGTGTIIDSVIKPDGSEGDPITVRITYCHGKPGSVKVGVGDKVSAGDSLMISSDTGSAAGSPHLHVQIDVDGVQVCPQNIFKNLAQGKGTNFKSLPSSGCIG